ncbi:unnamed protein product [Menidia menidia]|uniref:(Atlantic silverside) hypothetical protein n=1 Tax=Menidia menidia TaxID=238744 RepID=A0A8S4B2C2_9TELE|nr:unnamed protein product [Menidia menidia]
MSCFSTEVCPFCGKTYKRLKSHLPHCKAVKSSKTAPTAQSDTPNQSAPSHQAAALPPTTAKGKKSTPKSSVKADLYEEEGKNVTPQPSTPPQPASSILPSSTKTKKKKLSDQIRTAILSSDPSPLLPPTISKPKKKSGKTLIEAEKFDKNSEGPHKITLKGSSPSFKSTEQTETEANGNKASVKDSSLSRLSVSTKPKKKVSNTKDLLSAAKQMSDFQSSKRPHARDNFWVESAEEPEDVSVDSLFLKSENGPQGKVTIQDVKATLGRKSSRPSILSQIGAADSRSDKIRLEDLSPGLPPAENQKDAIGHTATPIVASDKLVSTSLRSSELKPVQEKCRPPAVICPAAPLFSVNARSGVQQAAPAPPAVALGKGSEVDRPVPPGLLSMSPTLPQPSGPLPSPRATQTLPGRTEAGRLDIRKQKAAVTPTEGVPAPRGLGQVRLRELPEWLASRTPTHPRDVVDVVQRGWQWYYRRYIDVKKGGVAGLGMLLAGYCVLSYTWSYPHIKLSRWRKYH